MKRWRKLGLAAVLIAVGYFARDVYESLSSWPDGYYQICRLETPVYDATIDILSPNFQELAQPLLYEVRTGGSIRIPRSLFAVVGFDRDISEQSFQIISSKEAKIVGIAFNDKPSEVLIIHDFNTDESWPISGYAEHHQATRSRGQRMLERLRQATGNGALSLSD